MTSIVALLARVLNLEGEDLSPEVARWLADLDFGANDRKRSAELSEKACEGTLSKAEEAELEAYGAIGRLLEIVRLKVLHQSTSEQGSQVREEPLAYGEFIVADPPPARIRRSQLEVGDILGWLAEGLTEGEILSRHSELQSVDVRASLAYAAEKERRAANAARCAKGKFTDKWVGKFTLKDPDPNDPRLMHLLERYEKYRS